jgi:hypothetical protein
MKHGMGGAGVGIFIANTGQQIQLITAQAVAPLESVVALILSSKTQNYDSRKFSSCLLGIWHRL